MHQLQLEIEFCLTLDFLCGDEEVHLTGTELAQHRILLQIKIKAIA